MYHILIIEDDTDIRSELKLMLENALYQTDVIEDFTHIPAQVDALSPDLILLDIQLPGVDGLSLCREIRKTKDTPVIFVTSRGSSMDELNGIMMGGDDYITKPFSVLELLARVRALLRRSKVSEGEVLEYAGITLDYEKRVAKVDGREISLTYKEFELLYFLLSNPNIVLTRDRLIEKIWGYDFEGETRTVDVHIASIRSKIEPYQGIIKTIRSLGYKVGDAK